MRIRRARVEAIAFEMIFWCIVLGVLALGVLVGCDQLREQPESPSQPAASPVQITLPENMDPERAYAVRTKTQGPRTTESGKGTGSGYTTTGDKTTANVDTTAPTTSLSSGGASSGGSARAMLSAQITDNTVKLACIIIGIVLAAAGIAGWRFLHQRMFLGVSAFGVGILMLGLVPWPVAALICVVAIGGALWFAFRDTAAFREGLRAVAAGVDSLPDMQRNMVKEEIGKHADERDKTTIKQIKRDDDLRN